MQCYSRVDLSWYFTAYAGVRLCHSPLPVEGNIQTVYTLHTTLALTVRKETRIGHLSSPFAFELSVTMYDDLVPFSTTIPN